MVLSVCERDLLRRACDLARLSPPCAAAYAVGAVLVCRGEVIIEAYSRMRARRSHAEEEAILQAWEAGYDVRGCVLYSSLQPCYRRGSSRRSCQDYIISAGLSRVVYARREPGKFLCHAGDDALRDAGIDVYCADLFLSLVMGANPGVDFSD